MNVKVKIHPLFILFGLYYAFTSNILVFVVCTLTAVIHELGHSIIAESRGYRLNKITLMPFGAVVSGDFNQPFIKDDLVISLAGPLTNLLISVIFVALWWIFPLTYPYTQIVVQTNFTMAVFNLLPALPLDGGRMLSALLNLKFSKRTANLTCKILGVILALLLIIAFILSAFNEVNPSILFFALFVLFGAFGKKGENNYIKAYLGVSAEKLVKGVKVSRYAVSKDTTVKRLIKILDSDAINEIAVMDGQKRVALLEEASIKRIILTAPVNARLADFI